jgi:hypothetical protein
VAGSASTRNSSRFPPRSASPYVVPVKLPARCARLSTTQADRVWHEGEHDLDRESGLLKRSDRRRRNCDDDLRPLRREVSDEGVQAIDIPFSAKYLDMRGAAVLVAKCGKRLEQQMDRGAMGEPAVQNTDMRTSLRASGRCDRAA